MTNRRKQRVLLAVTLLSLLVWGGWRYYLLHMETQAARWYGTWQAVGVDTAGRRYVCRMSILPLKRLSATEFAAMSRYGLAYADPAPQLVPAEALPLLLSGDKLYLPPQGDGDGAEKTLVGELQADGRLAIRDFAFSKESETAFSETELMRQAYRAVAVLPPAAR